MGNFGFDFWLLVFSVILLFFLLIYLFKKKENTQLRKIFIVNSILTLVISLGVLFQAVSYNLFEIDPMVFENFIYIGTCFLPVSIFFTGSIFVNTKINFKKAHLLLFIIPILSLIVLWTNNYHNLFYVKYSSSFFDTSYGSYFYVHTIYSYSLMFIGIIRLVYFSIKNSGFFSKQSLLMVLGLACPVIVNVLGSFLKVIPMTVFATPIAFSVSVLCLALAIFKFDFLKVAPIALQRVVDRMSDGYIIVNDENIVTDFNQTFLELFSLKTSELRNININDLITKLSSNSEKRHTFFEAINKTKSDDTTIKIERHFSRVK